MMPTRLQGHDDEMGARWQGRAEARDRTEIGASLL
jgi:hypothetical protein